MRKDLRLQKNIYVTTLSNVIGVVNFASATPFAEELPRPPKQSCALSSAAADKTHALDSAANVPGSRAIQRGDSQSHALYSAANVPSSRAIQRGDSKTNRAIQRGERSKLTRYTVRRQQNQSRYTARRRQSQTRYTARRTHQAHALSSAGTST